MRNETTKAVAIARAAIMLTETLAQTLVRKGILTAAEREEVVRETYRQLAAPGLPETDEAAAWLKATFQKPRE